MTKLVDNLVNYNLAFNKVQQTHSLFKAITANLKSMMGISFGYMKIFKDSSYYAIQDDLDCLAKFVTHTEKSSIFCERNVTSSFDGDIYNFTLWPNIPNSSAMKIYHEHKIWNGITVSKILNDYVELYWFTGEITRSNWHKFFIRNKLLLVRFIEHFDQYKEILHIDETKIKQGLFKFSKGFDINLLQSEYLKEESAVIKKLITTLELSPILLDNIRKEVNLSKREIEVLAILCHGYTMKLAAQKLNLSIKTIESYLDRIKYKTGLHFKTDLIKFYEKHFYKS